VSRSGSHGDVLAIAAAAITAASPGRAVSRSLRRVPGGVEIADTRVDLSPGNLCVVAIGKAARGMAVAAVESLRALEPRGIIVGPVGAPPGPPELEQLEAEHPLPGPKSQRAARRVEELLSAAGPDDLVLMLISGGASSLLGDWPDSIPAAAMERTTAVLLGAGMPIEEINLVRQQLATLKAGRAVLRARPARVAALLVSDVVGSDPSVIGSGLCAAAAGTAPRALAALEAHRIRDAIPGSVRRALEEPAAFGLTPVPADEDPRLAAVIQRVIVDSRAALAGARLWAERLGYSVRPLRRPVVGHACAAGARLGRLLRRSAAVTELPLCLLGGGETVVILRGDGSGGRNQELAASAALELDGIEGVCLCSIGTDGIDGPTPAAGAIVDGSSRRRARSLGLTIESALQRNDTYRLFELLEDLVVTGPTGTNVMDIQILLAGAR